MAEPQKKALVEQLALQRSEMTASREAIERELDFSRQLRKSLQNHPGRWALAGGGTAFLFARMLRRRKVIYPDGTKKRGFLFRTGKLAFSLARPALTTLALKYAKDYYETRFGPLENNSMLGGPPQK